MPSSNVHSFPSRRSSDLQFAVQPAHQIVDRCIGRIVKYMRIGVTTIVPDGKLNLISSHQICHLTKIIEIGIRSRKASTFDRQRAVALDDPAAAGVCTRSEERRVGKEW